MDFVFPLNNINDNGVIKKITRSGNLENIDILSPYDNIVTIDKVDYCFTYLDDSGKTKGGNSIILKLYNSQRIDASNVEYFEPDLILKILKFKKSNNPKYLKKPELRFNKEVRALKECKAKNFQNVITIFHSGTCGIYSRDIKSCEQYLYYTMEYADWDLKSYIESNPEMQIFEKIDLCMSLSKGIAQLFSLGYYHRDLKPDNIFIVNNEWKIADLGLLSERDENPIIDYENELIGPRGWLSPEAMNKYLCYNKNFLFSFDCKIDHQSDIFQLGRIFCYILQNNNPVGIFKQKDLYITNSHLYQIIRTMLNYSKKRRYKKIDEVIHLLKHVELNLLRQI